MVILPIKFANGDASTPSRRHGTLSTGVMPKAGSRSVELLAAKGLCGELGADYTDDLAHYARYALAETFFDSFSIFNSIYYIFH